MGDALSIALLTLFIPLQTNAPVASYDQFITSTYVAKALPQEHVLPEPRFVSQTYNNCGPAALSMMFSVYGTTISQEELGNQMRPFNSADGGVDDKSVFPDELVLYAKKYGFQGVYRPNGTINLLKQLTANGIPVIVRAWIAPGEDIGHFRIVRGYDEEKQQIIYDDSYHGPNLTYSYKEFEEMWRPFNYEYMLVYPQEKQSLVTALLKDAMNEKKAYSQSVARAKQELQEGKEDAHFSYFNLATAYYHLGKYPDSVKAYEKAEDNLPKRMLWYQLEPIFAYKKLQKDDRVVQLSDAILSNGNEAFSELYFVKGEVYLEQQKTEEARQAFEKAIYYNKNYEAAQKALREIES